MSESLLTWDAEEGWRDDAGPFEAPEGFYAVVGDPISHSLSPAMQMAAIRARGLAAEYRAARIRRGELASLKAGRSGLSGFNVTAPLKEEALPLCDDLTPAAAMVGAVNVVRVLDGKWQGHNSDAGAVEALLSEAWTGDDPTAATILGAGGAARAALVALVRRGVPRIRVLNRSAGGRRRFRGWLDGEAHLTAETAAEVEVAPLPEGGLVAPPTGDEIWVCCLPGGIDIAPLLPEAAGSHEVFILDLRYRAQAVCSRVPLGARLVDGEAVLLLQGGLSFTWWFGPPVPWDALRRGLADAD